MSVLRWLAEPLFGAKYVAVEYGFSNVIRRLRFTGEGAPYVLLGETIIPIPPRRGYHWFWVSPKPEGAPSSDITSETAA